jgi:hypothetical protein
MFKFLLSQFIKKTGRNPNHLEMILLKREAAQTGVDERKIISMVDRQPIDASKPILGGKNVPETEADILARLNKGNKESLSNMRYEKAVKAEEAKAAADEDYIMKIFDPEEFAEGGVAGLLGERTGYGQGMDVVRNRRKEIPEEIKKKIFELMMGTHNSGKVIENSERTKSRIGPEGVKAYGLADGGRTGYKDGLGPSDQPMMGPVFETNDPKKAAKEVIKRLIKLEDVQIPFDKKLSLVLGPDLESAEIKGVIDILGGELNFGAGMKNNEPGFGFNFTKKFAEGGRAGLYRGGQAEIEPSLSDIGHGSDALMARNALLTPGSQATTSTGLNYLLGEDNDTTRVPYENGKMVLPKEKPINEYMLKKLMSQAGAETLDAETREMLIQEYKKKIREKNSKAEGGRIGYVKGKLVKGAVDKGRRGFMKAAGVTTAGIAALKTGLLGFGKEAAPVVEKAAEAVSNTASQVPPYFFNLVKKIKNLGDDVTQTQSLAERQKVTKFKDFELTEDLATGRQEITRYKVDEGATHYGQPLTEETYMSYTPGEIIKGKKGKLVKTKPEYDEGTAYLRSDREFAGDIVDESATISDDVIKEGTIFEDTLSEFGKADGGRIGYGKGNLVRMGVMEIIKIIKTKMSPIGAMKEVNKVIGKQGKYKKLRQDEIDEIVEKTEDFIFQRDPDDLYQGAENMGKGIEDVDIGQGMIDLDELNFTKNAQAAKKAIDSTSDADLLMKKYPGMGKELAEQIATDTNPKRKADVIAMVEQTMEMGSKGMSGDEIIQTFKNTPRTKQATGGLATMLGE